MMNKFVPRQYIPYITAVVEGITLGSDELFIEEVAEGPLLVKSDGFSSMPFAFPDAWKPPQHTLARKQWLRAFFWRVTLAGHELVVEEDEGKLYLKEVLNEKEYYPWLVAFAGGVGAATVPRMAGCPTASPSLRA